MFTLMKITYNEANQLTCILCKSVVKSETVWTVHINSKQHKENVELAKTRKNTVPPTTTDETKDEPPVKKLKGILKNGNDSTYTITEKIQVSSETNQKPADAKEQVEVLPEGFFDDPKLDAKVTVKIAIHSSPVTFVFRLEMWNTKTPSKKNGNGSKGRFGKPT